ncbi:MAG: mechanosensitive ion channel family protein [Sphaerochaetaceae bacterium]|nr:mechanosensitive ion channel family protein [Sphaerochaetaceae bacterium]
MDTNTLSEMLLGEHASQYMQSILLVIGGFIVLSIANILLKRRIRKIEDKTLHEGSAGIKRSLPVMRFFQRIAIPMSFLGILHIAVRMVEFDERIQATVQAAFTIVMTIIIVRSINKGIELSFAKYFEKEWANHDQEKNLKPLLSLIKFLLWIVGFIFLLANLGLDVTTALAGLGVGGIAVAIAAQGILGDLFSYFVIFLDKPFELGDFIVFGDKSGVVERIGIKSSRIRILSGEVLIIANSDLTSSRIHNYKQMQRRRVVFSIGVTYETSQEHVEEIPLIIRKVIESVQSMEGVICDRTHFQAFGPYALIFETVYYVPSPDYVQYMDVQQEIYRNIFRIFNEKGIRFAYPPQRILSGPAESTFLGDTVATNV